MLAQRQASPSLSFGLLFCPLKASKLVKICSYFFSFVQNVLGSTMCPKLCQTLRESDKQDVSGAYILVKGINIHFNLLAISTLKEKQIVL